MCPSSLSSVNWSFGQLNSQSSGIRPSDVASPVWSLTGWVTHPAIPSFQILITGAFFHFRAAGKSFPPEPKHGLCNRNWLVDFFFFLFFLLLQKGKPWRWAANCVSPKTCLVFAWSTFFVSVVICRIYYARSFLLCSSWTKPTCSSGGALEMARCLKYTLKSLFLQYLRSSPSS